MGSVMTETLLAHGKRVRVLGRNLKKLKRFVQQGAEPFVAEPANAPAMRHAYADPSVSTVGR